VVHHFGELAQRLRAAPCRRTLTRDNAQDIADALLAEYDRRGAKCLSLDVFDTLLLRDGEPEALRFMRMAAQAAAELTPTDEPPPAGLEQVAGLSLDDATLSVFLARETATVMSYRTRPAVRGCREGHIQDIHLAQARALGLPDAAAATLRRIELEVEAASLAPNPAIALACAGVRERGGRVIAISDMYLDGAAIKHLIDHCFPVDCPVDYIVSSADRVVSKRSGLLFADVADELRLQPHDFLHIGDSLLSDVIKPIDAGWRGLHFPISDTELHQREQLLAELVAAAARAGCDITRFAKA
jgi:FMN phosphatase YigB (HAD superfamily)